MGGIECCWWKFGEGCKPLLNSCHYQWPLQVDLEWLQMGVLLTSALLQRELYLMLFHPFSRVSDSLQCLIDDALRTIASCFEEM